MKTARERILQKVDPKLLNITPKLSAENGLFIDLDSDSSLIEGAEQLKMRFLRNQDLYEKNKRNASQNEMEVTVTSAKYSAGDEICDILTERLKLPCSQTDDNFYDRPVKNLQILKLQLQEKISAKWEEEYKKRVNENKVSKVYKESKDKEKKCLDADSDNESDEDFDPTDYSEEDSKDEQGSIEDDGFKGDIEDEEEEIENTRNEVTSTVEDDDLADVKKTGLEISYKGTAFEEIESCSLPPAYQPGGGLLYGGSELTQCDEGLPQNLLSPSLKLSVPESPQFKSLINSTPNGKCTIATEESNSSFSVRNKLFSQNSNNSFDLNDAYEYCSGKFPDECSKSQAGSEASMTPVSNCADDKDEELVKNEEESEDEMSDESEDEDDNKTRNGARVRKNIIMFDESDCEENSNHPEVEDACEVSKILSDDEEVKGEKPRKKRRNLLFSDEEDENGESKEGEGISEKEEEEEEEEEEEDDLADEDDEARSVHYDSEENEIINPREFFEKEAELSGSEVSGDEDERGLDEFDVEEGDADDLDNDLVRSQLEKIHLRRVLDEDAREVRLIQEILFEDGDLHSEGKGRDRKFRWKHLGGGFEESGEADTKEEDGNSSEDEGPEEEEQRKLRHEKELFLMDKKMNEEEEDLDDEIVGDFQTVKVTSAKRVVKTTGVVENSKTVLDYLEFGKHVTLSKSRGSFLTRNEEFLSRLAKLTSGISDNVLGPKHSKNFVFATKSPEKMEPSRSAAWKRQIVDEEICDRPDKKFKILSSNVDTGPSIVDLFV